MYLKELAFGAFETVVYSRSVYLLLYSSPNEIFSFLSLSTILFFVSNMRGKLYNSKLKAEMKMNHTDEDKEKVKAKEQNNFDYYLIRYGNLAILPIMYLAFSSDPDEKIVEFARLQIIGKVVKTVQMPISSLSLDSLIRNFKRVPDEF